MKNINTDFVKDLIDKIDFKFSIRYTIHSGNIKTYLKDQEWFRNKDIWCYSGYTIDQIIEDPNKRKLLELVDVLVDGKFVDSLKDPSLKFRGSSNQNIYKIKHVNNHLSADFYYELM